MAGEALAATVRPFKLTATTETRNTCTYCSVACGILDLQPGRPREERRSPNIIHIEGDPDHPVNRGTLCPKDRRCSMWCMRPPGSSTRSTARLAQASSSRFPGISRSTASRRLMKEDRDANFIAKNAAGTTVNRWLSTGMLAASASSNETAYLTWKVARSFGCWSSTTRRVFDTDRRWPVWPQHSVAAR